VRNTHEIRTHFLIWEAQFLDIILRQVAAKAEEKMIEDPT